MPTSLQTVAASNVKVRWKEPYASEGINKKMAVVVPAGIYRGLGLTTNASNRSVTVQADTTALDHVAVYLSSDGYATTIRDDASGDITLDLATDAGNTVVIALFVEYVIGSDTTAELRSYELTEYDGLAAAVRDELVVLGTVNVPASDILIPAEDITLDRRTLAWEARGGDDIPWNLITRNSSFEVADTGATYSRAVDGWETAITSGDRKAHV